MIEKLREQAHLLTKATNDFYAGDSVAALSISVTVRALVHKTHKSTPLLEHIHAKYQSVEIYDKMPDEADAAERSAKTDGYVSHCSVGIRIGPEGFSPVVDFTSPSYRLTPLGSWWTRACIIVPIGPFPNAERHAIFSKRELILILANKEGGAHVDTNLPPDYEALVTTSPLRTFVNGVLTDTVNLARYAAAQTGKELLECVNRVFLA